MSDDERRTRLRYLTDEELTALSYGLNSIDHPSRVVRLLHADINEELRERKGDL